MLRYVGVAGSLTYRARQPEEGILHRIVRDHYETFRAQVEQARDGHGLPRFVECAFEGNSSGGLTRSQQ